MSEVKKFTCPACTQVHTGAEWNQATIPNAINRKVRRAYVPIEKGDGDKWYQCPTCGEKFSKKNIKEVR